MATTGGPVIEQHLFTDKWKDLPKDSAQNKFLHCWRPEAFLFGGRGSRKTGYLVGADAISANIIHAKTGGVGYLTEMTGPQVKDILIPFYKEFVNPELYHMKGSPTGPDVHWKYTDCITRLRSRQAKNQRDDPPFRGPSAQRHVSHDEICIDTNPIEESKDPILISAGMLRGGTGPLTLRCTTTPKKNFVYDYCRTLGITANGVMEQTSLDGRAKAFYSKTSEVDLQLFNALSLKYSVEFAKQELDAVWIDSAGRIWTGFSDAGLYDNDKLWPHSNIYPVSGYDPARPYYLGVDLGAAQSAFILVQPYSAVDKYGGAVMPGKVLVTVAEWTPSRMSVNAVLSEIAEYTGGRDPEAIWIGHDYKTPGGANNDTPELAFIQHGWSSKIQTHTGSWTFNKDAQFQALSAALCNSAGERRWCVAQHLDSFYADKRGTLDMFTRDTWPERGTDYFRKNKTEGTANDEDIRDAHLYLATGLFPPVWAPCSKRPAL
jgi:hypothetical protein